MQRFVEITDSNAVRGFPNLQLNGVFAGSKEWGKHNFYPNNGVVGLLLTDEAMGPEGAMCVIQCDTNIFVPVLPKGIKYITESEFRHRLPNNKTIGKDIYGRNGNSATNDIMNYIDSMFGR